MQAWIRVRRGGPGRPRLNRVYAVYRPARGLSRIG